MDPENKIIIITAEAQKQKIKKIYDYCYSFNKKIDKKTEEKIKKAKIVDIYDITCDLETKTHKITVNDHINKTGKNPLIGQKPIQFIDITRLYIKNKKGITTTCLGERYGKEKNAHPHPSTTLCLVAILCKKINPTIKINGNLVKP